LANSDEREKLQFAGEAQPQSAGWYATEKCWDVQEGAFPGAHYWNGTEWLDAPGPFNLRFHPQRFETKDAAEQFAEECDFGF